MAGGGSDRFAGDGGPAVNASLRWPYDLLFGPDRALYILDTFAARIRRLDTLSGTISTIAGNGEHACSGDGGPPLQAGLGAPEGIAFDPGGNLYITDVQTARIRVLRADAGSIIAGVIGGIPPAAPSPPKVIPAISKEPIGVNPNSPQGIRVSADVLAANLIKKVVPIYPPLAKEGRVQGAVRFTAVVGTDGTIESSRSDQRASFTGRGRKRSGEAMGLQTTSA